MSESTMTNPPDTAPASAAPTWRDRLRALWDRDAPTVIWSVVLIAIVLMSAIGPFFLQPPNAIDPSVRLQGPSAAHLLGTDEYGRDILSRIVTGGRVSLALSLAITVIAVVIGTLVGVLAGYFHRGSGILMRLMDTLMAYPPLVLAIALVVTLDSGVWSEIIALGIVFIPLIARVVRSRVLNLRERDYVVAARASGVGPLGVIARHILPNAAPTILVQSVFIYATSLLADSSLSFLGLGVRPPTPTWGNMVGEAKAFITRAPTFIVFSGVMIVITVMALNMVGEGLRSTIDGRARAILEVEASRRRLAKREATLHDDAPVK